MKTLPLILAGGLGSRLGTLAEGLPKPMVPVGGRPFLELMVRQLAAQGFPELLLLIGYRGAAIRDHFADGARFGLRIHYSEESVPCGTGGALKRVSADLPERFLMLYGDLYREFDYTGFCSRHEQAIAAYPYVRESTSVPAANVALKGGRMAVYSKGGAMPGLTHVDAGFGVFHRSVLSLLPDGRSSFEERAYPALAAAEELAVEVVDRAFLDVGNPIDLAHARAQLGR